MMRSRNSFATIEAAAIDSDRASPLTTACPGMGRSRGQQVAVDQRQIGLQRWRSPANRPAHRQMRGAQDIQRVDDAVDLMNRCRHGRQA
jgi:hypothetical protein